MSRVLLLREDGELATSEVTYVDNIHVAGWTKVGVKDLAHASYKQLKSRINSKGNQADDRKYCQPESCHGAWIGLIIHTNLSFPIQ